MKNGLQEVGNLDSIYIDNNKIDISKNDKRDILKAFGTFKNVFLSDDDVLELQTKMNYKLDNYIERLSSYIKSTGQNYKNHKARILSWYFKDKGNLSKKKIMYSIDDYDKGEHL